MRFILTSLVSTYCLMAYPQSGSIYPDLFSAYFFNMSLVNPSYIPNTGVVDLQVAYKFRQGLYSDIATFAASGHKLWRPENSAVHLARLVVTNEKEGPYISSPKAYINYAVELNATPDTRLMAGLALGIAGVNFSAPSGAGNVILADGGVGVGVSYKNLYFGVASMQVLNSEGAVINSKIRLQRYHNFNFSAKKSVSPFLDIKSHLFWRNLPTLEDQIIGAFSFIYKMVFEAGTIYFRPRGISYFGSLTLDPEDNSLFISITYNTTTLSSNRIWGNSFEIGLRYRMK